MISLIQKTIRGFVAPNHKLSCSTKLWNEGLTELRRRTEGCHESGAFLLGVEDGGRRRITRFAYYDDLDPHSLETGIVVFDGSGYGPLWQLCRESGLTVVADVHVHPEAARQSPSDRANPMIATKGHIALIVPNFAERIFRASELGVYEYKGAHSWNDFTGDPAEEFFYVGFWG
jgi:proteasome lid subunit RPN8/RPN11